MQRLDYLDNLKVFLISMVVIHHTALAFGGHSGVPYVLPNPDWLMEYLTLCLTSINQAYFMSLFFFISAYFIPSSFEKYGVLAFLQSKLLRLGVPLVIFYILLSPILVIWVQSIKNEPIDFHFYLFNMWFVEVLLLFCLIYAAIGSLLRKTFPSKAIKKLPTTTQIILFCLGVGICLFLARIFFPVNSDFFGLRPSELPIYAMYFMLGIMTRQYGWLSQLETIPLKFWWILSLILMALLCIVAQLAMSEQLSIEKLHGGLHWLSLGLCMWESFLCMGLCLCLLHFFKNTFNQSNAFSQSLSSSAYTLYILQCFYITAVTWVLSHLHIPRLLNFLLASILTVTIGFWLSNYIRKLPGLNKIL